MQEKIINISHIIPGFSLCLEFQLSAISSVGRRLQFSQNFTIHSNGYHSLSRLCFDSITMRHFIRPSVHQSPPSQLSAPLTIPPSPTTHPPPHPYSPYYI